MHKSPALNFTLVETAVGACGLLWSPRGIAGAMLPEPSDAATRARIRRRFPGATEAEPPPAVSAVARRIQGLLRAGPDDLADIALDYRGVPEFNRRVYELARAIAPGTTLTYGELAARLGAPPEVARQVGQALGANPFPIIVPCHRVLAAGGKAGGFSAPGGARTKLKLLQIEGAPLGGGSPGLFDA